VQVARATEVLTPYRIDDEEKVLALCALWKFDDLMKDCFWTKAAAFTS
jgi:hypothetical protein